jgi:hypothetical protein
MTDLKIGHQTIRYDREATSANYVLQVVLFRR